MWHIWYNFVSLWRGVRAVGRDFLDALNEETSPSRLKELSTHESNNIRMMVASHPNVTREILLSLVNDDDEDVVNAIAASCDDEYILSLLNDSDPTISGLLKGNRSGHESV